MNFAEMLAELGERHQSQLDLPRPRAAVLSELDVERWSHSLGVPRSELYDQIALHLARGFHVSELAFTFCDAVVNDLHGVISFAGEHRPDLFWEVFLAFDAGEFYPGNNRDEDPVEVYTRPMIARIINDTSSAR
jgi:hypothetical protein